MHCCILHSVIIPSSFRLESTSSFWHYSFYNANCNYAGRLRSDYTPHRLTSFETIPRTEAPFENESRCMFGFSIGVYNWIQSSARVSRGSGCGGLHYILLESVRHIDTFRGKNSFRPTGTQVVRCISGGSRGETGAGLSRPRPGDWANEADGQGRDLPSGWWVAKRWRNAKGKGNFSSQVLGPPRPLLRNFQVKQRRLNLLAQTHNTHNGYGPINTI